MSEETTAPVWMDDLDVDVCWRLIAGQPVGRVGFVWDGRPKVLPVNHAVDEKTIVVRTEHDTMLGGLHSDQIVAFEVDGADKAARPDGACSSRVVLWRSPLPTSWTGSAGSRSIPGRPASGTIGSGSCPHQ